jgi:hypothetical protein
MSIVLEREAPPFQQDETGAIRIGKTSTSRNRSQSIPRWSITRNYCAAILHPILIRHLQRDPHFQVLIQ